MPDQPASSYDLYTPTPEQYQARIAVLEKRVARLERQLGSALATAEVLGGHDCPCSACDSGRSELRVLRDEVINDLKRGRKQPTSQPPCPPPCQPQS